MIPTNWAWALVSYPFEKGKLRRTERAILSVLLFHFVPLRQGDNTAPIAPSAPSDFVPLRTGAEPFGFRGLAGLSTFYP